ncbi:hypothetical protein U91I_02146 [alpha proteobacterium U9-1i]|nr:hypothetical protein U91I_02146 [alpha proteobacterium U9-1i]
MKSLVKTLAAAAAICALAAPAYAQNLNTGATGSYGQVRLTSGFTPDPHQTTLNAGGPIDASTSRAGAACTGYVTQRPSFSLRYTAGSLPLYLSTGSDSDTTLVVRAPDGSWHCDDDSGGALNAAVRFDTPRSGRYQIWVGRFGSAGETSPAFLNVSEIIPSPSTPTEPTGEVPDFSLDPTFGAVDLTSGFQPDPHTVSIAAGGSLNAANIGVPSCVGSIASAPDYRVNWTAGSGALPLIFSVAAETDTTLVINDAQGNWVCDDDGGNAGMNPMVRFDAPASGQYDVWVGTYSSEAGLPASTLHVSELTSQ